MKKYKLSDLKKLAATGAAIDLTHEKNLETWRKNTRFEKIGYSCGIYGINGGLMIDDNGQLYVITANHVRVVVYTLYTNLSRRKNYE